MRMHYNINYNNSIYILIIIIIDGYISSVINYREAEGVTGYHPRREAGADDI